MAEYPLKTERRRRQSGFSLAEILISFAILSMAIVTLLPVLANSLAVAHGANANTLARLHLETLLTEVGAVMPLETGERAGDFDDGYAWRLQIEPYTDDAEQWSVGAYEVTATVFWGAGGRERSLSLTALRLGPKEGG